MADDITQVQEAIVNADKAGDGEAVRQLAAHLETLQAPTLASQSPFDPTITERGDIIYPYGTDPATGEEVLAWPQMFKSFYEGAMIPGRAMQGEQISQEEIERGAMAANIGGSRLIGGMRPKLRTKAASEIKKDASALYKKVENTPTMVQANTYDNMLTSLAGKLEENAIITSGYPKVHNAIRDMIKYKGKEMPTKRLMAHLKVLKKAVSPEEKYAADMVSRHIKEYLVKHGDDSVAGDLAVLKQADTLWAQGSTAKLFENALEKAKHTRSGFENGLRTEFGKILRQNIDGKLKTPLSPQVVTALEKVVDGTIPANNLRRVGKFGPGIGAQTNGLMTMLLTMSGGGALMAGNPLVAAGVAGLAAAGKASQVGATQLTKGAAKEVLAAQAGRVPTGGHQVVGGPSRAKALVSPLIESTQPPGLLSDKQWY
ncbi:MAG: hypothetical protein KAS66_05330 [Candidatus Omnitrophica bacterium]|nr:hypothetical protein [Candidatus Omnitrophota bacterium]